MLTHPYRPNTRILSTKIVSPRPVDPFERDAAGVEEATVALPTWNMRVLLTAVAACLLIWTAGYQLVKAIAPILIAWLQP